MIPQQDDSYSENRHSKILEIIQQASNSQWISDYWDLAKDLFDFLALKSGDPRLVISPRGKNRISISINQRWSIVAQPSNSSLGFIFPYDFPEIADILSRNIQTESWRFDPFKTETEETTPYFLWLQGSPKDLLTSTQKTAWQEASLIEKNRGSSSSHSRWNTSSIYQAIVDLSYRDLILSQVFPDDDRSRNFKKVNQHQEDDLKIRSEEIESEGYFDSTSLEDSRKKVITSITQRRGQPQFRRKLLTFYEGKCAITGCDVEAAIEAAHIIPYQGDSTNHPENGLPLRADIHVLFDLHLISIHPDSYEVIIAPKLVTTSYQDLSQKKLRMPKSGISGPSQEALSNHYEKFLKKHSP